MEMEWGKKCFNDFCRDWKRNVMVVWVVGLVLFFMGVMDLFIEWGVGYLILLKEVRIV